MQVAIFHNLPSGGAKRTLYEQVKRLAKRHTLDLYTLSTADVEFADIRPFVRNVKVVEFNVGRLYQSPFGRLNQGVRFLDLLRLRDKMKELAAEIDRVGYDVALIHPCQFTFTPTINRYLSTPTLYYRQDPVRWLHDPSISRPYLRQSSKRAKFDRVDLLRASYFKLLLSEDTSGMRAATQVVTNSYFVRETLYRLYNVAPEVVYHGVDTERFYPLALPRENFVLSVGSISPYKGFDFIIKGLAEIPLSQRPGLILVGNTTLSDEHQYLLSLAHDHEVKLDIREMVSDLELVRLYNQALCTVYTPVMEPFGLVPLESMACGTPVIGIAEGGVRETVVPGVSGYLVGRVVEELASTIVALVEASSKLNELGCHARHYVEHNWTWERSLKSLELHLKRMASVVEKPLSIGNNDID